MKKYLNLILVGGSAALGLLMFAVMAGTGVILEQWGLTVKYSVYSLISEGHGVAVTSLVFLIIGLLAIAFILVTDILNKFNAYNKFIALGVAFLFLVTAILFFCFASGDYSSFKLGAGSVFCALFSLIIAGATGCYGVLAVLKKN